MSERIFQRICVFCGSRPGRDPAYAEAATRTGQLLAEQGIGVVFGGGSVGLMGLLADGALAAGGEVIGVIPEKLDAMELGHGGLTRKEVVGSMHERKARMAELSDGFIALPGGYGTLEELAEATTWTQLNDHLKPVGLLDVAGYWDPLLAQIQRMVDDDFVREIHQGLITTDPEPAGLLAKMAAMRIPLMHEWVGAEREEGRSRL